MDNIKIQNNVQFKGLFPFRTLSKAQSNECYRIAGYLTQRTSDIFELTEKAGSDKFDLLSCLAKKYYTANARKPWGQREDSLLVNEIYKNIRKPIDEHYLLIRNYDGSFENLLTIIKATQNRSEKIKFVQRFNDEVVSKHKDFQSNLIIDLLNSPNSEEYIKHYDKYESYFILNRNSEDAIAKLDKKVHAKTYDRAYYDNMLSYQTIKEIIPFKESESFNSQIFVGNYTEEGYNILKTLSFPKKLTEEEMPKDLDKELSRLYLSTNKDNFKIRQKVINSYLSGKPNNKTMVNLSELNDLFEKLDADPNAVKFLSKLPSASLKEIPPSKLSEIFDGVPTLKLNIFSSNANAIIDNAAKGQEVKTLDKQLENPFFQTVLQDYWKNSGRGTVYASSEPIAIRVIKKVNNFINIIKYKHYSEKALTGTPDELTQNVAKPNLIQQLQNRLFRKQVTQKNVENIVSSKLKKTMFARQREAYIQNATKIRLSLLPDIFASVVDTRKVDRTIGKSKSMSSNKDVLELYLLIKGNNKKFVKYLLTKRNADNTRMFEIKDIISIIKQANKRIEAEKLANPQYKANDARKYYNRLYEAKVQQYGKA